MPPLVRDLDVEELEAGLINVKGTLHDRSGAGALTGGAVVYSLNGSKDGARSLAPSQKRRG